MKKAVRIYFDGTVQGVFFRGFVKDNADSYNVKGFVRNLDDGRVEVFAEGNADDVNKFVDSVRKGPKHSIIKKVDVKSERFQDFKNFKILHI